MIIQMGALCNHMISVSHVHFTGIFWVYVFSHDLFFYTITIQFSISYYYHHISIVFFFWYSSLSLHFHMNL